MKTWRVKSKAGYYAGTRTRPHWSQNPDEAQAFTRLIAQGIVLILPENAEARIEKID